MPIETVPNTDLTYYLIAHDADGNERQDDGDGLLSARVLDALKNEPFTDVFLLSHGWRGDVPAARAQYNRWLGAMAAAKADVARMKEVRPGFRPLLIGLHWPSEPWGDEAFGDPASFGVDGGDPIEPIVSEVASKTVDTPAAREALRVIVASALEDNTPPRLPADVRAAYEVLDREIGLGQGGEAAAPGDDREPFDPEAAYQEALAEEAQFGGFGEGLMSPIKTLSFWTMKDRARRFGEGGANRLLTALMREGAGRGVRFHLMGHSFGCIVVSATACGTAGSALPAPVDSLVLAQGALSLWSYCSDIPSARGTPGYFHRLISEGRVRGPIVATTSEHDRAVGTWYPWAAGIRRQVSLAPDALPKYGAVGTFGIRGPGAEGQDLIALGVDHAYGFQPGTAYNIECSGVINVGGGFSGAHSDIAKPEVAHAVWEAAMV